MRAPHSRPPTRNCPQVCDDVTPTVNGRFSADGRDAAVVGDALEAALATPYDLDVSTRRQINGDWVCRLEYVEIPGCVAESRDPLAALAALESRKDAWIRECLASGRQITAPRPRLRV